MNNKEAQSRIKINELLEEAGWRFFDDENGEANIQLELNVKITSMQMKEFGEDFEKLEDSVQAIYKEASALHFRAKTFKLKHFK